MNLPRQASRSLSLIGTCTNHSSETDICSTKTWLVYFCVSCSHKFFDAWCYGNFVNCCEDDTKTITRLDNVRGWISGGDGGASGSPPFQTGFLQTLILLSFFSKLVSTKPSSSSQLLHQTGPLAIWFHCQLILRLDDLITQCRCIEASVLALRRSLQTLVHLIPALILGRCCFHFLCASFPVLVSVSARGWWLSKPVPLLLCPQAALGSSGGQITRPKRSFASAAHLPLKLYNIHATTHQ